MADRVTRGNTITKDAYYRDSSGSVATPDDPHYSIINPAGVAVVSNAVPTFVSTGYYTVDYLVASNAELGGWTIRWNGTIDGQPVGDDDVFTVVAQSVTRVGIDAGQTCTPWATTADACGPCATYDFDDGDLDDAMQLATDVLFNLTGRRWPGRCTDVIRPQAQWRAGPDTPMWWPSDGSARWGWCSCHRGRETGCASVPEIKLPGSPVDVDNVTVLIDGAELDPGAYRVDDGRYLVRLDGEGWPCCQDLRADAATDEGTFQISYAYGSDPPLGAIRAAATLGCQYALACSPESEARSQCRLPKRVTTITRAGTTVALLDPMTLITDGLTGIPEVDQWVTSILFGDKRRRATVLVPGRHRSARRTS